MARDIQGVRTAPIHLYDELTDKVGCGWEVQPYRIETADDDVWFARTPKDTTLHCTDNVSKVTCKNCKLAAERMQYG